MKTFREWYKEKLENMSPLVTRQANKAAAGAVNSVLTGKNLNPGQTVADKLQDPTVVAKAAKVAVDNTGGTVAPKQAVSAIAKTAEEEEGDRMMMKKKMKKMKVK